MAEHVNNLDLFGSGGHQWKWRPREKFAKRLLTVGVKGAAGMVTALGAVRCTIEGPERSGGPALLKATAASKALADSAMDALELAIINLRNSEIACPFEDDAGVTGDSLAVVDYEPVGGRLYGHTGANYICWQYYRCTVEER